MLRPLILGFAALAPLLAALTWSASVALAVAVIALAHAALMLPMFLPRLGGLGPVCTRFNAAAREVWLTIDDGPDPADTPAILDLLDRHGARATFFVKGELAERHPELLAAIVARGHTLGNHTHTHPAASFWCISPARLDRELAACNAAIARVTGEAPRLFRAPVGIKSPFLHPRLDRLGMRLVAWSARGFDGVAGFDPERVVARLLRRLAPGSILVVHQGIRGADGRPQSPRGLERVLGALRERGYTCTIPALEALR
mgnify:CR=1 FL=1